METMQAEPIAPSSNGTAAGLGMPQLPPRGDRKAKRWWQIGLAVYFGAAFLFVGTLLGKSSFRELIGWGEQRNLSLFLLVIGGVGVTLRAVWSVWHDIRVIQVEEDDVEWLERHGARAVALVLAPADKREALLKANMLSVPAGMPIKVETLLDDRVRRAHAARMRSRAAAVSVEEMRVIAERRTARLGGFARYASTLLLLLAVLGTFAGVKTALPGLIDAVNAEEGSAQTQVAPSTPGAALRTGTRSGGGNAQGLTAPLRAVADAFGGNALALIGAIAVGIMAQGLVVGRRNFLERLELVSAEYVYGEQDGASGDPLSAAVRALQSTAEEVHATTGGLLGIEAGLETLGHDFRSALDSLDNRLLQVLEQQEAGLHERTSKSMEQLELRVASLAASVDGNARAYGGLIDRIGERAEESQHALGEMKRASDALVAAVGSINDLGKASADARQQVQDSSRDLAENARQVQLEAAALSQAVAATARAVESTKPTIEGLDGALAAAVARMEKVDERAAASWATVAEDIRQQLAKVTGSGTAIDRPPPAQTDLLPLLREIARNTAAPHGTPISRAALVLLPLAGLVLGVIVLFLLARMGILPLRLSSF